MYDHIEKKQLYSHDLQAPSQLFPSIADTHTNNGTMESTLLFQKKKKKKDNCEAVED